MKRYIPILAIAVLILAACTRCTTAPNGQKTVDPNVLAAIQAGAVITCGIAPTASAIANLYTQNPAVTTTETAIAMACAALKPNSVVPASVAPPITAATPVLTVPASGG